MTLYELLFILLSLATVICAIALLILVVSRQRASARKLLVGAGAVWAVYFVVLAVFDVTARQQVIAAGRDRCFDEMCFAVVDVQTPTSLLDRSDRTIYVVTIRATSHSRGRTQAEGGLRARLYADGQYFDVSRDGQREYELQHGTSSRLTQRLGPGESIQSVLIFDVPRHVERPGLALDHGFTPGYFVIGESPFFHKPDILQLP